jgi:hypothetical protein
MLSDVLRYSRASREITFVSQLGSQVSLSVAGSAIATILHHPTRIRIYSCTPL